MMGKVLKIIWNKLMHLVKSWHGYNKIAKKDNFSYTFLT